MQVTTTPVGSSVLGRPAPVGPRLSGAGPATGTRAWPTLVGLGPLTTPHASGPLPAACSLPIRLGRYLLAQAAWPLALFVSKSLC